MDRTTREYQAIVWVMGSGSWRAPQRLTVTAHDEDEARRLIVEQFGDEIRCSIWIEEDARTRWPRTVGAEEMREYKAIVWTKEPEKPGRRVTVQARSLDEARKLVAKQFGHDVVCSIWNEDDANRTR